MSLKALDNLVEKTGDLRREAPSNDEITGLLSSAQRRLADAQSPDLSLDSRFELDVDETLVVDLIEVAGEVISGVAALIEG